MVDETSESRELCPEKNLAIQEHIHVLNYTSSHAFKKKGRIRVLGPEVTEYRYQHKKFLHNSFHMVIYIDGQEMTNLIVFKL